MKQATPWITESIHNETIYNYTCLTPTQQQEKSFFYSQHSPDSLNPLPRNSHFLPPHLPLPTLHHLYLLSPPPLYFLAQPPSRRLRTLLDSLQRQKVRAQRNHNLPYFPKFRTSTPADSDACAREFCAPQRGGGKGALGAEDVED
jgi:hypothetical protein